MEIRWLPRKSRRKTQPASPRGWKHSPLIGARVPQSRAHIWRLGPGNRELERLLDLDRKPVVLHSHAKVGELEDAIRKPGFYRIVLRSREGKICGRRDFQAAWRFPRDWDPATARGTFEPTTVNERLAAERDALREKLKAAEARSKALEAERDAARARVAEVEQSAGVHAAAVREDARERIAEAARHRAALEALLAERDAELRRVRGLYVALADGGGGGEAESYAVPPPDSHHEPERAQRSERGRIKPKDFDLEQLAAVVLRIGERVGLVGPAPDDDDADEDDEE